jgi:hypothetical protein
LCFEELREGWLRHYGLGEWFGFLGFFLIVEAMGGCLNVWVAEFCVDWVSKALEDNIDGQG